jgi:signal transduction histidine kinase
VRRSFRARLTLSYAILTALLLTLALGALAALLIARTIATTRAEVEQTASTVRTVARAHWSQSDDAIVAALDTLGQRSGVRVNVFRRPPGDGPPPSDHRAPPPGDLRQPPSQSQPQPQPFPPPDDQGPPPDQRRPPAPPFGFGALLGVLQSRFVPLHDGVIEISPDDSLRATVILYAVVFGIAEIVSVLASVAIGRAITQQAVRPLATVTAELQRFARGDFASIPLETSDRNELGDLVTAYNGAAAQVAAAFSERERTERRLRLFLGEAGHEMRTPMTVISAYLDLLAGGPKSNAKLSPETLESARTQMRRLRGLVERVMALARMEGNDSPNAELIDVVEIAQEAIASVTAVRGGTVRLTHDADDVVVRAEPWELREAIGNLIDNAVVYGDTPVDVAIAIAGTTIVVRVHDDGPGINAADRARLFQHFFRGDASFGTHGSGLGLAIVARAAARLGGTISLEDPPNARGTTFRLEIPIYQPDPARHSKPTPKFFA